MPWTSVLAGRTRRDFLKTKGEGVLLVWRGLWVLLLCLRRLLLVFLDHFGNAKYPKSFQKHYFCGATWQKSSWDVSQGRFQGSTSTMLRLDRGAPEGCQLWAHLGPQPMVLAPRKPRRSRSLLRFANLFRKKIAQNKTVFWQSHTSPQAKPRHVPPVWRLPLLPPLWSAS